MNKKINNLAQIASVRRYTITDGRAKGLEVIDCDNGKIRFLLNVTKALDVMQLYHEGTNISFLSKNAYTAREINFLNRFEGGMLYTCGLDNAGGRDGYELHGRLHNTPAEVVSAKCDENGIEVVAYVRMTALFGENLVLCRKITSAIGSDSVTLSDTLTNEAYRDEEYCLLYHINAGYPMLDEGAYIKADIESSYARSEFAKANIADMLSISDAVDNQEEQCFYHKLRTPEISLVNEKLGKTFTVSYTGDTLPYFIEWKSMASGDYALGLEPSTTTLDDNFKRNVLGAGESVSFGVTLTVK